MDNAESQRKPGPRVGRTTGDLRPVSLSAGIAPYAEGSCLVSFGDTRVLCTASVEAGVPGWRRGSGQGWITAEYAMLPRATRTRTSRERAQLGGRTQEIQRLIGRSVRAMLDDFAFGEYTLKIDCDVLQADGGTRTASISGACVAVVGAFDWMAKEGKLATSPVKRLVAAVSVGLVDDEPRLDLDYEEDVRAGVDMNVVMSDASGFVEVQGTGEHGVFDRTHLDAMLDLATAGIRRIDAEQRRVLGAVNAGPYLLATRSAGKLRELRPLFEAAGFHVIDLGEAGIAEAPEEEAIESFATFEENALAKARWFHARSGGLPTIADDSGLAVDALGGEPGVHSRRWSGVAVLEGLAEDDANNAKLLASLDGVSDRRARYVCVAALVDACGELVRRGETVGEILVQRSSGTHGFGYDPFFQSSELGRSFAEASVDEKSRVSHRGRAFRALIEAMRGRA